MGQKKDNNTKSRYPELVNLACDAIEEKMGRTVNVYDVRGRSSITDYFIVVSAASAPQLKAISDNLSVSLKKQGFRAHRKGGDPESGWIVVDYIDVIIHLFLQETRDYYAIEELWAEESQ